MRSFVDQALSSLNTDLPQTYQDDFIGVLPISSVSSVLSIEHEYASVMFTLDGVKHPLLRSALFQPVGHGRIFEIDEVEY